MDVVTVARSRERSDGTVERFLVISVAMNIGGVSIDMEVVLEIPPRIL
jgi:hypothetical protein